MRLTPGSPYESTEATLVVDAGLAVGKHRIQLVVENGHGERSKPVQVVIEVVPSSPPTET
jgi:hypothetical protein